MGRFADAASRFTMTRITRPNVKRQNVLCSLSDDELSPAALAARVGKFAHCVFRTASLLRHAVERPQPNRFGLGED